MIPNIDLKQYPSAFIKLNDLFAEWLLLDASPKITEYLNSEADSSAKNSGSSDAALKASLFEALIDRSHGPGLGPAQHQPPRSPLSSSKSSPKKRPQSEMMAGTSGTSPTQSSSQQQISVPADLQQPHIATDGGLLGSGASAINRLSRSSDEEESVSKQSSADYSEAERHKQVARRRASIDAIPVFYKPASQPASASGAAGMYGFSSASIGPNAGAGRPRPEDALALRQQEIESYFRTYPGGVALENFVHVTKNLCGFPSFFNKPLFQRVLEYYPVDEQQSGTTAGNSNKAPPQYPRKIAATVAPGAKMKLKTFLNYWQHEIEPYDNYARFFRLVKNPHSDFIRKDDLVPIVLELLLLHPGLEFLSQHDEFKRKYALTVIARIFYKVNLSRTGRITCRELRRSQLVQECMHVDEETDINRCVEFFSYEHFYVLYCRYFELDTDRDGKISRDDLMKYGDYCLSEAIVERIFQVGHRAFTDKRESSATLGDTMSYSDFIYFMISEEDKTTEASLMYWFACCDLDGDGVVSAEEMRHFYKTQLQRINNLGQESVKFQDMLCQMVDMICPARDGFITLHDMCRPDKKSHSGLLFDALFNLHKFLRFETRDPFQEKIRREDPFSCDWDRFAHTEYQRLAAEEEGGYDNSMEIDDDDYDYDPSSSSGGGGINSGNSSGSNNSSGSSMDSDYKSSSKGGGGGGKQEKKRGVVV